MLANVGEPRDPGGHGGELLELGDGEQPIARFVRHAPSLLSGDPAAGVTLRARFYGRGVDDRRLAWAAASAFCWLVGALHAGIALAITDFLSSWNGARCRCALSRLGSCRRDELLSTTMRSGAAPTKNPHSNLTELERGLFTGALKCDAEG